MVRITGTFLLFFRGIYVQVESVVLGLFAKLRKATISLNKE